MGNETSTFGDIEIDKKINFDALIVLVFLEDLDIEKVLVSNNISSGEKKL